MWTPPKWNVWSARRRLSSPPVPPNSENPRVQPTSGSDSQRVQPRLQHELLMLDSDETWCGHCDGPAGIFLGGLLEGDYKDRQETKEDGHETKEDKINVTT